MSLANRFGIDYGAIVNTENAIKNARLLRKKSQREMEKEDAIIDGTAESIADSTTNNPLAQAAAGKKDSQKPVNNVMASAGTGESTGTDGEDTAEVTPKENALTRADKIALIAKNKQDKVQQAEALKVKQTEARKRMYVAQGMSEQDAEYKSILDTEEVSKFQTMFQKADDAQQKAIRNNVNESGNFMASLIKMGDNPQQAEKLYVNRRTDRLEMINKLRKQGKNKEADEMEQRLKTMPKTILKPDGSLNNQFLTNQLTQLTTMVRSAEDNVKEQDAVSASTRNAPVVKTVSDKDYLYTPNKKTGVYEVTKSGTSNALQKARASSSGSGGYKTADWSLLHRQVIAQETGLDINSPDLIQNYSKLSSDKRKKINELEAKASRIAKNSGGAITMSEALVLATKKNDKEQKRKEPIKDGAKGVFKGKAVTYKNGDWVDKNGKKVI